MAREMIKKLYYSIGEVSEITDLKQYVLRYWESEFPQLSPSKNRAGNRTYREKDIDLVNFIKTLLYEKKYTIEGARQKLKELQDAGQPLTLQSLEPEAPPPAAAPLTEESSADENGLSRERYEQFLRKMRQELSSLVEMLES